MNDKLESFKSSDVIRRAIDGNMTPQDFRIFNEILNSKKPYQKSDFIRKLSTKLSDVALHKLAGGLLQENSDFKQGNIPSPASLAGIVMKEEASRHQPPLNENEINIERALNITLSHYKSKGIDKPMVKKIVESIYHPIIEASNPIKRDTSYDAYLETSSGSIGGDYGPSQEDLDRIKLINIEERELHKQKLSQLKVEANNLYVSDKTINKLQQFDAQLELRINARNIQISENFITNLLQAGKLPPLVHDPLDLRISSFIKNEITPKINELMKTSNNQFLKPENIDKFVNSIGDDLVKLGITNFNKNEMPIHLNETYLNIKPKSEVKTKDKILYSLGKVFEKSGNGFIKRLGNHCLNLIDKDSLKTLEVSKSATGNILNTISVSITDKAEAIGQKVKHHLNNQTTPSSFSKRSSCSLER